jgi:hypothetical protein
MVHHSKDSFQNRVSFSQHVDVPDAKHRLTQVDHVLVANSVALSIAVLTTINFNHQTHFPAGEVRKISPNRQLANELELIQAPIPKFRPQRTFSIVVGAP